MIRESVRDLRQQRFIFLRFLSVRTTMADKDKDNDEVEATIADEAVVTKYKTAGEIANRKFAHFEGFTIRILIIHTNHTHNLRSSPQTGL